MTWGGPMVTGMLTGEDGTRCAEYVYEDGTRYFKCDCGAGFDVHQCAADHMYSVHAGGPKAEEQLFRSELEAALTRARLEGFSNGMAEAAKAARRVSGQYPYDAPNNPVRKEMLALAERLEEGL